MNLLPRYVHLPASPALSGLSSTLFGPHPDVVALWRFGDLPLGSRKHRNRSTPLGDHRPQHADCRTSNCFGSYLFAGYFTSPTCVLGVSPGFNITSRNQSAPDIQFFKRSLDELRTTSAISLSTIAEPSIGNYRRHVFGAHGPYAFVHQTHITTSLSGYGRKYRPVDSSGWPVPIGTPRPSLSERHRYRTSQRFPAGSTTQSLRDCSRWQPETPRAAGFPPASTIRLQAPAKRNQIMSLRD